MGCQDRPTKVMAIYSPPSNDGGNIECDKHKTSAFFLDFKFKYILHRFSRVNVNLVDKITFN